MAITDKQETGEKHSIKLQAYLIRPINPASMTSFPRRAWAKLDNAKINNHRIWVEVSDINTVAKMAKVIRDNYGFGRWGIKFYSRKVKNQAYSKSFECIGERCNFFSHCRIKSRHQKGWSCWKNPHFLSNWVKRAEIIIKPIESFGDVDYVYRWIKGEDMMSQKFKWFWREGVK